MLSAPWTTAAAALLLALASGIATAQSVRAPVVPACAAELDTPRGGRDFRVAAAANAPAVVTVASLKPARDPAEEEGVDPLQPLAGNLKGAEADRSVASGFILDADGHVATSAHVIADATESWVLLADGRSFRARVVGLDSRSDVALLKIAATNLPQVQPAQERPVCPGEWIAAVGAPFGFHYSVSAGIVSAYPRYLAGSAPVELIQTDVALNPGSSGGPLFNTRGQVVGMSSSVYSGSGFYMGVSFAVPIHRVLRVVAQLKANGFVPSASLGARFQPLNGALAEAFGAGSTRGALVIAPGGGLRVGDIVTAVDGIPVDSSTDTEEMIASAKPGTALRLAVWRDRRPASVVATPRAEAGGPPAAKPAEASTEALLGMGLMRVSGGTLVAGLYVRSVGGSALLAGIEAGDRILAVNGRAVTTSEEVEAALDRNRDSRVVAVLLARGTTTLYLPVRRTRG